MKNTHCDGPSVVDPVHVQGPPVLLKRIVVESWELFVVVSSHKGTDASFAEVGWWKKGMVLHVEESIPPCR